MPLLRRIWRAKGYGVAVSLNLGLGVGLAVGAFGVLHTVVLAPLPYPEPDRLVVVHHELPGIPMQGEPTLFGGFQGQVLHYRERSRELTEIGFWGVTRAAVSRGGQAESLVQGYASRGFFQALGVGVAQGRPFGPGEPRPAVDGTGVALLGPGYAAANFGRPGEAVGARVSVEGYPTRVVGVVSQVRVPPLEGVSIWTPRPDGLVRDSAHWVVPNMLARMAPGATPESLQEELDALIQEFPERTSNPFVRRAVEEGRMRSRVVPLEDWLAGDLSRSLWLLLAACGLVWIVALVNCTGLVMVRTEARGFEFSVRAALGARPADLLLSHAREVALLTVAAGLVATAVVSLGLEGVSRFGPPDVPRIAELSWGVDVGLVMLALLAGSAGVLAGLPWLGRRLSTKRLPGGRERDADRPASNRLRAVLASAQVAIAVALLVAAGLILRSARALGRVDPGFTPEHVLTFRVTHPFREIRDAGSAGGVSTPFFDALSRRLSAIPGVTSAGYGKCVPLAAACGLEGLTLERADGAPTEPGDASLVGVMQVGPGFVETIQLPLQAGRSLEERDHRERTNAILLSADVATRLFGGGDAIGRRVVTPDLPGWKPFTVVGVVGEVHYTALRQEAEPLAYLPIFHSDQAFDLGTVSFVVRSALPPASLMPQVRSVVSELRPDAPVAGATTLGALVRRSTGRLRAAMWLLWASAVGALVLGATGVYGVIAYTVALRRREFGIRLALGARGRELAGLVLRDGAAIAGVGLAVGVAIPAVAGRFLGAILYSVGPLDPVAYGLAVGLLALATLAALLRPARRAANQDPAEILRGE